MSNGFYNQTNKKNGCTPAPIEQKINETSGCCTLSDISGIFIVIALILAFVTIYSIFMMDVEPMTGLKLVIATMSFNIIALTISQISKIDEDDETTPNPPHAVNDGRG